MLPLTSFYTLLIVDVHWKFEINAELSPGKEQDPHTSNSQIAVAFRLLKWLSAVIEGVSSPVPAFCFWLTNFVKTWDEHWVYISDNFEGWQSVGDDSIQHETMHMLETSLEHWSLIGNAILETTLRQELVFVEPSGAVWVDCWNIYDMAILS